MKADLSRLTFEPSRHRTDVISQQGRVLLDADWNEQRAIDTHLRTRSLIDIIGPAGAPIDDGAFEVTVVGGELTLSAGRYYLDGHLLECEQSTPLTAQPDLPAEGPFVQQLDGTWLDVGDAVPAGVYVAALTSWQQHRTAIEEPSIREVALGGPDTTTRLRQLWQVRLLGAGAPGADVSCADEPPGWADLTGASTGTLVIDADPEGQPAPDCLVPEASPYRGLDNQLYRVEIHQGGVVAVDDVTFVWSSDNGVVLASWEATDVDVLTVKNPGRDGSSGFTSGCWVELTDDPHEQLGLPGTLVQVDRTDGDRLVVLPATATGSIDRDDFDDSARARRWDGTGAVPDDGVPVPLELGISATFGTAAGATYRTGDHWMAPARTATADVEWPAGPAGPIARTPDGPVRRAARLAVLDFDGATWTVRTDCRPVFAPLVDHLALHYVGGDGQEALPDVTDPTALVPLDAPLAVGVATGGRPVAAAPVRFEVTDGTGTVDGASTVTTATGADGRAAATWLVDSTAVAQTVTATLLDHDGTPIGLPLVFTATLSQAAEVSYDPSASPSLAGTTTVQEALDRLAAGGGGGCETLVLSPDGGWQDALENLGAANAPGQPVDATVCLRPGRYATDRPVRIRDVRHLRITGAGSASELVGLGVEAVLVVDAAASVVVRDLAITVATYPDEPLKGQAGALTIDGCGTVEVSDVAFVCPPAIRANGTCLTVASTRRPFEDRREVTDRVTVRDCRFRVGHAQTGLLVIDAVRSEVRGCSFETPQPVDGFGLAQLFEDKTILGRTVAWLVGRPVTDRLAEGTGSGSGGRNTELRIGDWQVRFDSAVPAREWMRLVSSEPPTAADTSDAVTVRAYLDKLTTAAVAGAPPGPVTEPAGPAGGPERGVGDRVRRVELDRDTLTRVGRLEGVLGRRLRGRAGGADEVPSVRIRSGEVVGQLTDAALITRLGALPTFDRQLESIRAGLGEDAAAILDGPGGAAARRALLVSSTFDVIPRAEVVRAGRDVVVAADVGVVRFDSPLAQDRWELALADMAPPDRSGASLVRHLRAVGRRLLTDPDFSVRVAPGLLDRLRARQTAVAANGVRIGGRVAEVVAIHGNVFEGAAEAVHIGLADHRGSPGKRLGAGSVRVCDNEISVRVPIDRELAPRAIFLGNVDAAVVTGNRSTVSGGRALHGTLIDGVLGPHVVVRDNEQADAEVGVRITDRSGTKRSGVLWIVADNLLAGATTSVIAPPGTRVVGNVP